MSTPDRTAPAIEQAAQALEFWLTPRGRLLANPCSKRQCSADALTAAQLAALCRLLADPTGAPDSAALVAALVETGLIRGGMQERLYVAGADLPLLPASTHFWDYSDPQAWQKDGEDMLAYSLEDAQRMQAPCGTHIPEPWVPPAARPLLALAHHILDAQSVARFHHQSVEMKRVPSLGARHGIRGFLFFEAPSSRSTGWAQIMADGTTREASSLFVMDAKGLFPVPALVLCGDYERYQWRYRNAWIYQCLYLDLGHVLAAMQVYARQHGLHLQFAEVPDQWIPPQSWLVCEPLVMGFFEPHPPLEESAQ